MARPRTPTAELEARGGFLKHPERKSARAGEPKPTGELGDPPEELNRDEKKVWREVAALIPPGVAKNSDRIAMELIACLLGKFRRNRASVGEINQLLSLLAKMGMTPADRSRVVAVLPESQSENLWDRLLAKKPH